MEMCEEVFEKLCYIEYKKKAEDETVEVCNDFLSRDCEEEGKEIHKFGKNFVKLTQLGLNLKKKIVLLEHNTLLMETKNSFCD